MKILVVGDWHSDLHEHEVVRSFKRLGHEVSSFRWFSYFESSHSKSMKKFSLFLRFQNKFLVGPILNKINRDFITKTFIQKPDLIFVYRGTHIFYRSLKKIKEHAPDCKIVGYNNDDPFSHIQPKYLWRHFLRSVPYYDLVCAYRERNLPEFTAAGAKRVVLLRSWFIPDRSYKVHLSARENTLFDCDVVFAGHYEPDDRMASFEDIVKHGYSFRLFGPSKGWAAIIKKSKLLGNLAPIKMAWGNDYNKALSGSKIALCFLSKLNRDTYTRRCFEIPATRTFLLSEYSDDLASLYEEGIEAEYFRDRDEMLRKINFYINNPDARKKIAEAGYKRAVTSGYDIDSRMEALLKEI